MTRCKTDNVIDRTIKFSIAVFVCGSLAACGGAQLKPWHTEKLTEEFTREKAGDVRNYADYLALEERLFRQLDEKVYAESETGPEYKLDRYSPGSAADPRGRQPDWNQSFELATDKPRGAILLLHGMSDSPYSLRSVAEALNMRGYWVLGIRLPGHGTAPSGLRHVSRHDMAAAVRLGMKHLGEKMDGRPVHMIGYSTGASLALEFTLDALEGKFAPVPASLVLISPAIGIHSTAGMARFKNSLGRLPGLSGLGYLQVQPEFDPYKYNSFATDAVVDSLLNRLKPGRHELVLFDINRHAAVKSRLIVDDPAPLTDRLMSDAGLPFTLTLVTNADEDTTQVVSREKEPLSIEALSERNLELAWPRGGDIAFSCRVTLLPRRPALWTTRPGERGLSFPQADGDPG